MAEKFIRRGLSEQLSKKERKKLKKQPDFIHVQSPLYDAYIFPPGIEIRSKGYKRITHGELSPKNVLSPEEYSTFRSKLQQETERNLATVRVPDPSLDQ